MKTAGHTRYQTEDGGIVPGVTTAIGLLAKPALIRWANKLGLDGIDSTKYTDNAADIGTLAHSIVTDRMQGIETNYSDYTPNQIIIAENSAACYYRWGLQHTVKPILIETSLVSEQHRFGGTPDLFADVDGIKTLIDLKTGSAIWPEFVIQVAAYRQLLREHGHKVEQVRILNLPRCGTENWLEVVPGDEALDKNFEIFRHLLEVYKLQRQLK